GAVQRDEALATSDEIEQCRFLILSDVVDVGIDDQAVVAGEVRRRQRIDFVGVNNINLARRQCGGELAIAIVWLVVPVVAEEEELQGLRLGGCEGSRREQGNGDDGNENGSHGGFRRFGRRCWNYLRKRV